MLSLSWSWRNNINVGWLNALQWYWMIVCFFLLGLCTSIISLNLSSLWFYLSLAKGVWNLLQSSCPIVKFHAKLWWSSDMKPTAENLEWFIIKRKIYVWVPCVAALALRHAGHIVLWLSFKQKINVGCRFHSLDLFTKCCLVFIMMYFGWLAQQMYKFALCNTLKLMPEGVGECEVKETESIFGSVDPFLRSLTASSIELWRTSFASRCLLRRRVIAWSATDNALVLWLGLLLA